MHCHLRTRIFFLIYFWIIQIKWTGCLIELDFSNATLRHETNEKFLSFTLDSYQLLLHWAKVDLRSESLINMTKQLAPAYLRVGGTHADDITFNPRTPKNYWLSRENEEIQLKLNTQQIAQMCGNSSNISMSTSNPIWSKEHFIYGEDILLLKGFIEKTGAELIYDLNALQRNNNGEWDPTNSRQLIRFMSEHNMKVKGWELGNEPDHFLHVFNVTVSPHQHAEDFTLLKRLIKEFHVYNHSLVIGPDTTRPIHWASKIQASKYLKLFLKHVKPEILSKITIHQYFFNSRTATPNDFLNVTTMNHLKHEIRLAQRIARKFYPNTPLWIGETSSGWGGGCPGISDRFAESFMWLDKLGLSAKEGIDVVFRQTLVHGNYGLINKDGHPAPDYFVSVLYKRLVGRFVIENIQTTKINSGNVDNSKGKLPKTLRLYTHCSAKLNGNVVIFGINVGNKSHKIHIQGQMGSTIEEYLVTAPRNNILSRFVRLNGIVLKLDKENQVPAFVPTERHQSYTIPATSVGFWVLPKANISICN